MLGKVELVDGTWVTGFLCEPYGFQSATDTRDSAAGERGSKMARHALRSARSGRG
ncbi:allophanate hydrolase-related protein [Paraburkholderia youngii]|uniref:allophanate hydrolase-related protein n=1 Tax=Paraburkholderia youngii TaxID=2782701 RepID=UPI00359F26BB